LKVARLQLVNKPLRLYTEMYIEKSFELLGKQVNANQQRSLEKGTFNDYLEREYTQASGSGGNPGRGCDIV
jgi:hypothetical protein